MSSTSINPTVLRNYTMDVIDNLDREYNLIVENTRDIVKNVKNIFKYIFSIFPVLAALTMTLIGSKIIDLFIGTIILIIILILAIFILWRRQKRIRKMHDAYGEHIAIIGKKRDVFLKLKKEINYWEYVRTDIVIKKDDYLTPKNIRNSLVALEVLDFAHNLYLIHVYEKLLFVVNTDEKRSIFQKLMIRAENANDIAKEIVRIKSKPLPFYIQKELSEILFDNQNYISTNFSEPVTTPKYKIFLKFKDYLDVNYGGSLKLIQKIGLRAFLKYTQKNKMHVFLLDKDLNVLQTR